MTDAKICNFNCICNRDDCSYKHYLNTVDERKAFKELFDATYDKSRHNETDPKGERRRMCLFGHLCGKDDCGFKHFCNIDCRRLLQKSWYRVTKKSENKAFLAELGGKYQMSEEEMTKLMGLVERPAK